jgi:hypothetical protein
VTPVVLDPAREAKRARRSAAALAVLYGVAALHGWYYKAKDGRDFGVVLTAGARALRGETLYRLGDGHWCYKYSPPVALLAAPLSLLPPRVASLLLALASAAALVAISLWAAERLDARARSLTHLAVAVLAAPYTLHLFQLGQLDAVLVAGVVASERLARRRPALSGLLLALPCLVKPPLLLLLAVPVLWQEGRRLAGFAATAGLAAGLFLLRYGAGGFLAEVRGWRALLAATTPGLLCDRQNQSLWAVTCTFLAPPSARGFRAAALGLALVFTAALAALAAAAARDRLRARFLVAAAALYAAAPLSPLGWRTNLLGAIPLLYLLVQQARQAGSRGVRRASLAAGLVVLAVQAASYDLVGERAFQFLLEHRHYALAAALAAFTALGGAAVEARRLAVRGTRPVAAPRLGRAG